MIRDAVRAFDLFQRALDAGEVSAALHFALVQESGLDFRNDREKMCERFWRAVNRVRTLAKEPEFASRRRKFFKWWRFGFFDCEFPTRVPRHGVWPDWRQVWFEGLRPLSCYPDSAATAERNSSECGPPPLFVLDGGDGIQPPGSAGSDFRPRGNSSGKDQNLEESGDGAVGFASVEEAKKARRRHQGMMSKRRQRARRRQDRAQHDAFKKTDNQRKRDANLRRVANAQVIDNCSSKIPKKPPDQGRPNVPEQVVCLSPVEHLGSQLHRHCASLDHDFRQSKDVIERMGSTERLESPMRKSAEQERIAELELQLSRALDDCYVTKREFLEAKSECFQAKRERSAAIGDCSHWKTQYSDKDRELYAAQTELAEIKRELASKNQLQYSDAPFDRRDNGSSELGRHDRSAHTRRSARPQDLSLQTLAMTRKAGELGTAMAVSLSTSGALPASEAVANENFRNAPLGLENLRNAGTVDGSSHVVAERNYALVLHPSPYLAGPVTSENVCERRAAIAAPESGPGNIAPSASLEAFWYQDWSEPLVRPDDLPHPPNDDDDEIPTNDGGEDSENRPDGGGDDNAGTLPWLASQRTFKDL